MSSGSHLSKDCYDLIKSIGEAFSKQDEDKIMTQELKYLKSKINDKNLAVKTQKEHIIRAIYLEMLGYNASFAYIHAVNLTQNKSLKLKKIGYLACSLFFNEDSEFLILLVSTIQKDLMSSNNYVNPQFQEVIAALNILSKLLYQSIIHALINPIFNLLNHKDYQIRKKAIIITYKMYKQSPSLVPDFDEKLKKSLCDQHPSVMGATINIYYEEMRIQGIQKYKELVSSFVVILKQTIDNKLPREYDYHRMPAPWIQIKIIQILGLLGQNDQKASEHCYEVLQMVLVRSDDTGINIGYAMVYQCVRTIAQIYPNKKLLENAANSICKFFQTEINNLKYLGINSLKVLLQIDPKYAASHQLTVVECLESTDETLKRETLELLYKMTNQENIEFIIEKLMDQLKQTTDAFFKKEMVNNILSLIEKFAPTQEWFLDQTLILIQLAYEHINDEIINDILRIFSDLSDNDEEFTQYVLNTFKKNIEKENINDPYIKLRSWILGQLGANYYSNNQIQFDECVDLLAQMTTQDYLDQNTYCWILNSLGKFLAIQKTNQKIKDVFQKFQFSKNQNIQQRSIEYDQFPENLEFLKQGYTLERVDVKLSFLNNFVQSAISQGAKKYKESLLQKICINQKNSNQQQLNFQPYNQQNQKSNQEGSNEFGLNITGPQRWGKSGYQKEVKKEETRNQAQSMTNSMGSNTQNQSISSQGVNKQNDFANVPVQFSGGLKQPNQTNYVSNEDSFKYNQQKPVSQPQPARVDPKEEQRRQMANQLFNGMSKTSTQQLPKPVEKKITRQEPPKQNQFDLFNHEQEQQRVQSFKILDINLDQYEGYWNQFPKENSQVFDNTKIKDIQGFRSMCSGINVKIIEVIENEVVCASLHSTGPLLLYGIFKINGQLTVQLKSQSPQAQQDIIQQIRKFI